MMDVKERIVDTTAGLFRKRGVKSVTMDEIALENGISKRTLYELFKDKSDLIEAVILYGDKHTKCFFEELKANTDNILELIIKIYEQQSEVMINTNFNFYSEVRRYYPEIHKRTVSKLKANKVEHTTNMLRLGQEQGVFINNFHPDLVAKIVSEMMSGMNTTDFLTNKMYSKKEIVNNTMMIYIRGLSTEKGRKILDDFISKQQ